mmetsp:Transcript_15290/g.51600  ORF Transcript_15290/g.51600 Transcript_15290/m.51600 type:complete len:322 (+) Transcript_15290:1535-2500(+)
MSPPLSAAACGRAGCHLSAPRLASGGHLLSEEGRGGLEGLAHRLHHRRALRRAAGDPAVLHVRELHGLHLLAAPLAPLHELGEGPVAEAVVVVARRDEERGHTDFWRKLLHGLPVDPGADLPGGVAVHRGAHAARGGELGGHPGAPAEAHHADAVGVERWLELGARRGHALLGQEGAGRVQLGLQGGEGVGLEPGHALLPRDVRQTPVAVDAVPLAVEVRHHNREALGRKRVAHRADAAAADAEHVVDHHDARAVWVLRAGHVGLQVAPEGDHLPGELARVVCFELGPRRGRAAAALGQEGGHHEGDHAGHERADDGQLAE